MVLVAIWETRDRLRAIKQGTDIGYAEGKAIGRAKGRAIGYAESMEQAHAAWRSWFYRRETAAANGLPFNEPMPTLAPTPNPSPSHPA